MTFYLVDERLDIQLVNLFGYKGLVVSQGCNDTLCQGKSFVTRIKSFCLMAFEPAFLDKILELVGMHHDGETRAAEEPAELTPAHAFA